MSHLRINKMVQVRERNVNMALATSQGSFPFSAKGAEFTASLGAVPQDSSMAKLFSAKITPDY